MTDEVTRRFGGQSRTNGAYWQRTRRKAIQRDSVRGVPYCTECGQELSRQAKKGEPGAIEVDHVQPFVDRPDLEFELTNLVTLCQPCHKRKTRAEARVRNAKTVGRDVDEWSGRERSELRPWFAYLGASVAPDPFALPAQVRVDASGVLSIGWGDGSDETQRVWTGRRWLTPSQMREEFGTVTTVPPAETAA